MLAPCAMLVLAFVVLAHARTSDDRKLPKFIHLCYRDDPNLSECVKESIYSIIRKLASGIPELGVPTIEPLLREEIDAFDVAGFRLKVTDIVIRGISGIHFNKVSAKPSIGKYSFEGLLDPVSVDARYKLRGAILFLPVESAGTISFTAKDVEYSVTAWYGTKRAEDGEDYVHVDAIHTRIHVNDAALWIGNLGFFEMPVNRLLNNRFNMRLILDHLMPTIDDAIQYILLKFANRIFNVVPYDVLLPKGTGPVATGSLGNGSEETESVTTGLVGTWLVRRGQEVFGPVGIRPAAAASVAVVPPRTEPVVNEAERTGPTRAWLVATWPIITWLIATGPVETELGLFPNSP